MSGGELAEILGGEVILLDAKSYLVLVPAHLTASLFLAYGEKCVGFDTPLPPPPPPLRPRKKKR